MRREHEVRHRIGAGLHGDEAVTRVEEEDLLRDSIEEESF
eukprot:CAMPEP_0174892810 /NCGR_PEP_ID=MMETSP0167-20121228/7710_1 /TAXON_ID=38298 /ORGANISM="Rhodella maculata, Strain CCMP736" /LENGTH=39 /DNA_ID= /DNA_START= /DNA_END= /DNA_ORIENTATION=